VTDLWSVGVGARYWTYNMRDGTAVFDRLGFPPAFTEPARYDAERYGVFFQTEYRIGGSPGSVGTTPSAPSPPANWTGVYAGGNLGGGFSNSRVSDPFGSTDYGASTNEAGFGDKIHAPGPIAGGQIAANWQMGHWVVGAEADADWSDMRGDGTCFSGLGGMDCQQYGQAMFDVAARGGFAWERSWLYAKAGAAWASTRYDIWGDTNYAFYDNGGSTRLTGGWLVGAGLEYALSDKWSASLEYDHVGLGSATPSFPGMPVLAAQSISVGSSVDTVKVGLSYKLF
jgi:opacity protein-like surface antigen